MVVGWLDEVGEVLLRPALLQDGKMDFLEYVAAVHLLLRGKLEDKLRWSFKVYDRDGNGRLDKQEVRHIVKVLAIRRP